MILIPWQPCSGSEGIKIPPTSHHNVQSMLRPFLISVLFGVLCAFGDHVHVHAKILSFHLRKGCTVNGPCAWDSQFHANDLFLVFPSQYTVYTTIIFNMYAD